MLERRLTCTIVTKEVTEVADSSGRLSQRTVYKVQLNTLLTSQSPADSGCQVFITTADESAFVPGQEYTLSLAPAGTRL